MPSIYKEKVLDVTHYNEGLFSFRQLEMKL